MSEFARESEFGAADRTQQIATVRDFFDAHTFAKAHLAQLFAGGTLQKADVKFATDLSLFQRNQRILLQKLGNVGGRRHAHKIAY